MRALTSCKKYPVTLTEVEREQLKGLIAAGTTPARKLTHARILLKANQGPEGPGWVDEQVADAVEVSQPTVARVRKRYFEEGFQAALDRRPPNREYQRRLEVYTRPYDPRYPQVCMDEVSKQLLRDTRTPLPMEPGRIERRDYEYERGGVVNLFLFCEPLRGRRWVEVTERRTKTDWARQIKELVDERYPEAEQIVLVTDNPNTHAPASLYEAFAPAEARRLAEKPGIHYIPSTAAG